MIGFGDTDVYEVLYNTGGDDKTGTISVPAGQGKPGKGLALEKLADPSMMMVPPEDITVKSIKKARENTDGSMEYY